MNCIWFSIRRNGVSQRSGWVDNVPLNRIREHLSVLECDVVEVCVVDDFFEVATDRFSRVFYPRARGLVGIEITYRDIVERYAPTTMVASNLSFVRAVEKFIEKHSINRDQFTAQVKFRAFAAKQFLIFSHNQEPINLFRGSVLIESPNELDSRILSRFADRIAKWMIGNLSNVGEIPYKYWPSRGEYSSADNAIRRFLATIALARYGKLKQDSDILIAANRNLQFNLSQYYQAIEEQKSVILERTGAKLGASALASLAIIECQAGEKLSQQINSLAAGIQSLVDKDVGFRTFFFPSQRDRENWNFYSGEALLFWAEAIRMNSPQAPTLNQFRKAALCCRKLHRKNRNPAFIPWHVQACVSFIAATDSLESAPFVFEISDWLLSMQQWDCLTQDLRGRFYNPNHPEFGPPHAASTGVYLEGLVDALWLARKLGDIQRKKAYEKAINRGFRSLRQLQFRNEKDSYYVSQEKSCYRCNSHGSIRQYH